MSERTATRRSVLAGTAGLVASLAGCIHTSATPPGSGTQKTEEESVGELQIGGSSTVYPITDAASSYWNANIKVGVDPEKGLPWNPHEYGIQTDKRIANYWGGLYGFDDSGPAPPFKTSVILSHSGIGLKNLRAGLLDIADSSAPVKAELDLPKEELAKFVDHVVGVDAQPIVVSTEIFEDGVTGMTADTLRAIYKGDIKYWRDVPGYEGPDKKIQCVGRAVGSGTDTAFRMNLFGNPEAPIPGVDVRKGSNQAVSSLVANSDNAIAYMALAFVGENVEPISLTFEGTTYVPGENLADQDYPLARDLHCYTYKGTSKQEAAFIRMILSDYGQRTFVKTAGYAPLTDKRQQDQLEKLPDIV